MAPITIGAVFPLSGSAGRIGEMKRQGADLAVEHLNAAGGVAGRPLRVVYLDSKNSTTEGSLAFGRLADVEKTPVVMAAMSQVCLALAPAADRKQVVLFANASHPELTRKSPFVFRNLPSTEQGSTVIAETAYGELGLRRVAVLAVNDEYGAEAGRVFVDRFTKLGGAIVGQETFELGATDYRAALTKLAQARPDGWWIPGYGAALGVVLKQRDELKLPGQVLCDLGLVDQNVISTAGGATDRVVVVAPAFDPGDERPAVQRFVRDFEAKYKESPSFDAAFQYDAVHLIADAMRRAPTLSGDGIRTALAATSGFVGVCGATSFDPTGQAKMPVVVRLMADGRLLPLDQVQSTAPTGAATDTTPTDVAGDE
ncbi:MAG: ABC transporter substrate-binding protein [Armatimonadetes bacterium]|nr:ABC transporter substrate-binding protein [Armatimonadota bacterium]